MSPCRSYDRVCFKGRVRIVAPVCLSLDKKRRAIARLIEAVCQYLSEKSRYFSILQRILQYLVALLLFAVIATSILHGRLLVNKDERILCCSRKIWYLETV